MSAGWARDVPSTAPPITTEQPAPLQAKRRRASRSSPPASDGVAARCETSARARPSGPPPQAPRLRGLRARVLAPASHPIPCFADRFGGARASRKTDLNVVGPCAKINAVWACSSAGRALPSHGRGHEFESRQVHFSFLQKKAPGPKTGGLLLCNRPADAGCCRLSKCFLQRPRSLLLHACRVSRYRG